MRVVWVYGPPCSGKSHMLNAFSCIRLDSHGLREVSGNWALTDEDRTQNILNLAATAKILTEQGYDVAVAAITPKRQHRVLIRSILPEVEFMLAKHDPKGLGARQAERFGKGFIDEGFEYDH